MTYKKSLRLRKECEKILENFTYLFIFASVDFMNDVTPSGPRVRSLNKWRVARFEIQRGVAEDYVLLVCDTEIEGNIVLCNVGKYQLHSVTLQKIYLQGGELFK